MCNFMQNKNWTIHRQFIALILSLVITTPNAVYAQSENKMPDKEHLQNIEKAAKLTQAEFIPEWLTHHLSRSSFWITVGALGIFGHFVFDFNKFDKLKSRKLNVKGVHSRLVLTILE